MRFALTEYSGSRFVTAELLIRDNKLEANFHVGDELDLRWPEFQAMTRASKLWQSTCFELFVGNPDQAGYLEFNFSPSGQWNCFSFSDYRQGMQEYTGFEPINLRSAFPDMNIELSQQSIFRNPSNQISLGVSAVLQSSDDVLLYFSLAHGDKPDFHLRTHHVLVDLDQL